MKMLTASDKGKIRRVLEAIVGPGAVLSDPDELMVYESDGLTLFRALADFVVFPTSAEHVSAIVKLANRENLPFVARGAGRPLWVGAGKHEFFFASTHDALEVVEHYPRRGHGAFGRVPADRGWHRDLAHADEPRARGRLR